ncbi:hypothetical protein [Dysgonomonas sp. 25]|uniref:hypothetical protein n=1 Tax=Dysgonomonas sp. 25 TaxID=2302933 RepID=UPI0013D26CD7|nr:hypothetical protein [Dysgonomonas sp. 25]NDV69309.1 hypothetical protein [Dysgonomonas sp. 25]
MKKLFLIFSLSFAVLSAAHSQSYTAHQASIEKKLSEYRNDEVTTFINETLQLFNKGTAPSQQLLTGTYALGVVYVMDEAADCSGGVCSNPAADAAIFESGYSKMGMMRIRSNSQAKRPLPEYVWMHQSGRVKNTSYSTKYMLEYLGQKVNMHTYTTNAGECLIGKNTFVRQNGNELIAVSLTSDYSKINIYRFAVDAKASQATQTQPATSVGATQGTTTSRPIQKVYEVEDIPATTTRQPIAQKEYVVENNPSDKTQEYVALSEYDLTLANLLQQVINNRSLTVYYKSDNMYIVSSGLFRDHLEVKYKDKCVDIQNGAVKGKNDYVKFVSSNYDGKTNHNTEFRFSMPTYGVGGKAVFKYTGDKWFLSEVVVVAE